MEGTKGNELRQVVALAKAPPSILPILIRLDWIARFGNRPAANQLVGRAIDFGKMPSIQRRQGFNASLKPEDNNKSSPLTIYALEADF